MNNLTDLQIICTKHNAFDVNSYCLMHNRHVIVIDPVLTDELKQYLALNVIDFAILTHEHYDHICCVNDFQKEYGAPVLCGEKAVLGLSDPSINMSRYVEFLATVIPFGSHDVESTEYKCVADNALSDEQFIEWQGHSLLIKDTPGHSKGSICILLDNQYLFSGDTLFKDYPTATRMPGGSTKEYRKITVPWLDSLPQDILVYPGHLTPFRLSERCET